MEVLNIQKEVLDVYSPNSDWKGRIIENNCESVDYQNGSTIRIWYNEQTIGFAPHWHNALEVILPIENSYDVRVNDEDHHILPGEIFFIPPGEMHELMASSSGTRFIFLFNITNIMQMKGYAGIQSMLAHPLHITKADFLPVYDEIYRLFGLMWNEYFSDNDFRELSIYAHLIQIFVLLGRNKLRSANLFPNVRNYKQKEYMQRFSQVLDYIDTHYMEELTLDDIADFSGFSKYHFTRLFKQYTTSTFYDYLNFKRIKVAESLLAQPDLSITEIALQSGFSSISTFNRIFKQKKNCTPSQYRTLYHHTL